MKTGNLLYIPILLVPMMLFAQKDISGRTWGKWDPDRKIAYVVGFYAGLKADAEVFREAERSRYRKNPYESAPLTEKRFKYERKDYYDRKIKYDFKFMLALLDNFYTVEENVPVPVPQALRIVMVRESGELDRSRDLLLKARRAAAGKD
ncbi:MAG: hypothetical protein KAU50_02085 [Candidatus Marinimicrobia bacterium]|nr:hypothetical protein [Candidatus Neomarinimicrobiota bacterium]